jgi:hypothetical protein
LEFFELGGGGGESGAGGLEFIGRALGGEFAEEGTLGLNLADERLDLLADGLGIETKFGGEVGIVGPGGLADLGVGIGRDEADLGVVAALGGVFVGRNFPENRRRDSSRLLACFL